MSTDHQSPHQHRESFNLAEVIQVVRLRRKLLFYLTALIIVGVLIRHVLYVPLYRANTELMVQGAEANPVQIALSGFMGMNDIDHNERINRYLKYINSFEFYLAVAEKLKFDKHYSKLKLTHPDEMSVVRKKFWIHFISSHFNKQIKSTDPRVTETDEPVLVPVESLASIVHRMTNAKRTDRDIITVTVSTLDPFTSMMLANTVADTFVEKTTERDYNEVTQLKKFLEEQLVATTERLKNSELRLVEFKKRNNIISIDSEQRSFSTRLGAVDSQFENARIEYRQNEKLIEYYSALLRKSEAELIGKSSKPSPSKPIEIIDGLRTRLESLRRKQVMMRAQGYSEESPDLIRIGRESEEIKAQLKQELAKAGFEDLSEVELPATGSPEEIRLKIKQLKTKNKELATRIDTIKASRNEMLGTLQRLPQEEQELIKLTRDVNLQFELYSSLKKKLQETQIQQVALRSNLMISRRASQPAAEHRASLGLKLLFAALAGGFLGTVLALLLEALDPTVKYRSDLEELELSPLGDIPRTEGLGRGFSIPSRKHLLVTRSMPESPESMAFKHVRAQLMNLRSRGGRKGRAISITSAEPGDGKTFTASNLAVSLAQLEKRVVIVDCDFRNPAVPEFFGLDRGTGLSSLMNLKATIDEVMIREWAPNLDILPSGWSPENPSELISNDKFRILLEHLEEQYDFVIIDCPPAVAVVDAAVIAGMSDLVLIVASYRKTRKDSLTNAVKKIVQITHKRLYAVLNNVWETPEYAQYAYYQVSQESPFRASDARQPDTEAELRRFESSLKNGGKKAG